MDGLDRLPHDAVQVDELRDSGWEGPVISAVTGQGVRELVGRLAALVHEAREAEPVVDGVVVLRPEPTGALDERARVVACDETQ